MPSFESDSLKQGDAVPVGLDAALVDEPQPIAAHPLLQDLQEVTYVGRIVGDTPAIPFH